MIANLSSGYSPQSSTFCKRQPPLWRFTSPWERERKYLRREYARLLNGLEGHHAYLLTIVQGHGLDCNIRRNVWHRIWTRIRQVWPAAEAWTVIEFRKRRGVHLHAVIKGASSLTQAWIDQVTASQPERTSGHLKDVHDPEGLAHYLTKDLRQPDVRAGWPRHFRPCSSTRGWYPSSPQQSASASARAGRSQHTGSG
jgi:hypothetical protein